MYRSFVLVGLGGSGGKTIRFVKRALKASRRDGLGWRNPSVAVLAHRYPDHSRRNELNDVVDQVGLDEYLGLVGDGVGFRVTAELDGDPEMRDEMSGGALTLRRLPYRLAWRRSVPGRWAHGCDGTGQGDQESPKGFVRAS